jgi:hypothetical protein
LECRGSKLSANGSKPGSLANGLTGDVGSITKRSRNAKIGKIDQPST